MVQAYGKEFNISEEEKSMIDKTEVEDENGDSWEADDDEDECGCPCCGSVFSYQRNVTVEYCSQPVKKAEAVYLN